MPDFYFHGGLPASKSLLNRGLVIRSYAPKMILDGHSDCDDVVFLKRALAKLEDGKEFYCGDGGTTLRFFALRASRETGSFVIKGTERLFQRPQAELLSLFSQLSVEAVIEGAQMIVRSTGWRDPGQPVFIDAAESSQFASAVILNAWNLEFPLEIKFKSQLTSESYLHMTIEICKQAGMQIEQKENGFSIPAKQQVKARRLSIEPDFSSAFAIAAAGVLAGQAEILNLPQESIQPDATFIKILADMGAVDFKKCQLKAVDVNLQNSPDLFPVLAVLCAVANGQSKLYGAPQLRHKESDRIMKVGELLKNSGFDFRLRDDGIEITGRPDYQVTSFIFDPDHDHRMAMAAGLLNLLGYNIRIQSSQVVNKSFPGFWDILRQRPIVFVGHRGTGKSSLLQRTESYMTPQQYEFIDLDSEISKELGLSIEQIFRQKGEAYFRDFEVEKINHILENCSANTVICAGAGIQIEKIHKRAHKLWIRRETDLDGRLFFDRPRLDENKKPLQEYKDRARLRQEAFLKYSNASYTIPEGLSDMDICEKVLVTEQARDVGGCVTILPSDNYTQLSIGADYFEIRDDLLEPEEVISFISKLDSQMVIYSLRKNKVIPRIIAESRAMIDWGLELGYPDKELLEKNKGRMIISSHAESIKEALMDLKLYISQDVHLKLCPLIENFDDLKIGHMWWAQNPQQRSFLPRSKNGIWAWYRLYMKGRQKINYWRHGLGSSLDQPTLWHWLATSSMAQKFACVLGHPVHHSYTPVEHRAHFRALGMPIWSIDVVQEDWFAAFGFLKELGLIAAAVTSPLKEKAFLSAEHKTSEVIDLQSANTLLLKASGQEVYAHNTDLLGLQQTVVSEPHLSGYKKIVIWGGGGTLEMLKAIWPHADCYSARTGLLREGREKSIDHPELIVWAAPRATEVQMPPEHWKPNLVLDLNYKEDSMGREYALKAGVGYESGLTMFKNQAAAQRKFWSQHGC